MLNISTTTIGTSTENNAQAPWNERIQFVNPNLGLEFASVSIISSVWLEKNAQRYGSPAKRGRHNTACPRAKRGQCAADVGRNHPPWRCEWSQMSFILGSLPSSWLLLFVSYSNNHDTKKDGDGNHKENPTSPPCPLFVLFKLFDRTSWFIYLPFIINIQLYTI